MLKEGKEQLFEIPNIRDLYDEVLRLREVTRKKGEYRDENAYNFPASIGTPSTKYLCQWLEKINENRVHPPNNLEEEKVCILSNIVFNAIMSIAYKEYWLTQSHGSLGFKPSEEIKEELKEKGYYIEEDVWYDNPDTGESGNYKGEDETKNEYYYYLRTTVPKKYQQGCPASWGKRLF